MSTPHIGDIRMVGFNFAPVGWAFCDGRLLSIAEYDALFNLIGTTYGGDGETTFALPDLRGRAPIHQGQGAGLSQRQLGAQAGGQSVILTPPQLPPHDHAASISCHSGEGNSESPVGAVSATAPGRVYRGNNFYSRMQVGSVHVEQTGSASPHNNMSPFLTLNFIIALEGIFPSQS